MYARWFFALIAVVCTGAMASPALAGSAERAAESYKQGDVLLAQGDFDGAVKAFAAAVKADRDNEDYRQQYALVRQIVKLRKRIGKERNPEKWEKSARALRAFYYEHRIYSEALSLDREFHTRLDNAESAAMLAETELNLGMNDEAAELLAGLDSQQATPRSHALLGIALARQGKLDDARGVAEKCQLPDDAGPGVYFDVARLRALLGDASDALAMLTRCCESTLPSRLEALKYRAKECKDFRALAAGPEFAKVLETPSKIKESGCSSGSSCGKCPSRTSCGKGKSSSSAKDKKP